MSSKTRNYHVHDNKADKDMKGLYMIGGAAALVAGIVFRRNIGAEVSLFSAQAQPTSISDWFSLLHSNVLLGLAYLSIFDIVDYALLGLMFLALYAALKQSHKSAMTIATTLGLGGITIYCASNTAFSMLSLSDQYAVATTETQKSMLLVAGQAVLPSSDSNAIFPNTGIYMSFLFLALASLIISMVMLRSDFFNNATAYVGIFASVCDLLCCITFAFIPSLNIALLSTAGLLLMIWHVLIGVRLWHLGRGLLT